MAMSSRPIQKKLIAPCGMNCRLCLAMFREKRDCPGCRGGIENKSNSCIKCRIKNCNKLVKGHYKYCYECDKYPCARITHVDKRYRSKYGMSMIENLNSIKEVGINAFIEHEKKRWLCKKCGKIICVHRSYCVYCKNIWR
jgi:hypothetical protein